MTAGREPGKGDVAVGGRGLTHGAVDRDRVAVGIEVHAGRVGGDKQAPCEPQATSTRGPRHAGGDGHGPGLTPSTLTSCAPSVSPVKVTSPVEPTACIWALSTQTV